MKSIPRVLGLTNPKNAVSDAVLPALSSSEVGPRGSIPTQVKARMTGWGEPPNFSTVTWSVDDIQSAIRMAERGDVYRLYALYRDVVLGSSHIQGEMAKRKMVVVGQPVNLQPYDAKDPDDIRARDACKQMMEGCENWSQGLTHLLDASLWPAVAVEKIFQPWKAKSAKEVPLRVGLKRLEPVPYPLFCYKIAYILTTGTVLPGSTASLGFGQNGVEPQRPGAIPGGADPLDTIYDPDSWEPELRFYATFANGMVDFSWANMYRPDPMRHIIHRANLISGIRDNMGGPMRSIMFWWWFSIQGRDWWARAMERWGAPFPVVTANMNNVGVQQMISSALQAGTKLFGLALPTGATYELSAVAYASMSQSFECFLDFCHHQQSKAILGQETSSKNKPGGLNEGNAHNEAEVRDDYRQYDQHMLNECLSRQLCQPFLDMNGIPGRPPIFVWGGLDEDKASALAATLKDMKAAGLQPKESSMESISEKIGIEFESSPEPDMAGAGVVPQSKNAANKPKSVD